MKTRAFCILAFVAVVLPACAPRQAVPAWKTTDFTVKLHRLPDHPQGAGKLASRLRAEGYTVVVISDTERKPEDRTAKENYSVMWIGKEVPVPVAAKAIRLTHLEMPWVKYVFVQYENADWKQQLFMNAHEGWVTYLGLEPLSEADFAALSNEKLSADEFHRMIEKYRE